jgi:primosomal protein N' (replication factor Y)
MKKRLTEEMAARGAGGIEIIGPAPVFFHRLRGRFRWQLILRGFELSSFLSPLDFPQGWTVDIDPMGLIQ